MGVFFCMVYILLWDDLDKLDIEEVTCNLLSVEGMNFDYLALNFSGFFFYFIYNLYGYFIDHNITGQVDLNDLLFSIHALFATIIVIIQAFYYPH